MAEKEAYLGTALKYPVTVNEFGRVQTTTGKGVIPDSIANILQTPLGSRFMLPEYGSQLHELLFEPNDTILNSMLIYYITNALSLWEKRIKVIGVTISLNGPSEVNCEITYEILQSNEVDSFVYPFYRQLIY